jgi:hypothetical protein
VLDLQRHRAERAEVPCRSPGAGRVARRQVVKQ